MSSERNRRMYHINLGVGECAKHIVLVGDPARTKLAESLLGNVTLRRAHREFVSVRGRHRGLDITILSTGIGPDNTEIVMAELLQVVRNPTIIRAGSCGSLQDQIRAGELVISTASVRLENTTEAYAPIGYPAVADMNVVLALKRGCEELGFKHHLGVTATTSGFYGPQGRGLGNLRPRDLHILDSLRKMGVANFEMETSAIFTLSQIGGAKAGAVCAVFADRVRNTFLSPNQRLAAETKCLRAALRAHLILSEPNFRSLVGLQR